MRRVSPADVLAFTGPTTEFLCPLEANVFDIQFGAFKIRDADSGTVLLDIEREYQAFTEDSRFIQYSFPPEFLSIRTIGTTLSFSVGGRPVHQFRMIERHYIRDRLLQSYDFSVPFCIPNSKNTWEAIYSLPELSHDEIQDIVENPFLTKSDSFFFVEDALIMHTRAEYDYSGAYA
jgi:hypothetical protein